MSEEKKPSCEEGQTINGQWSLCGEPATHKTFLGYRCYRHVTSLRKRLMNPRAFINVISGVAPTKERVDAVIKRIEEGEPDDDY